MAIKIVTLNNKLITPYVAPVPPTPSLGYGYLYNWFAYSDIRKLYKDSSGFQVPSDTEYDNLISFLGGSSVAGQKLKTTGTEFWNDANGTNEVGFNGKGAGQRNSAGTFEEIKNYLVFWSIPEYNETYAPIYAMASSSNEFSKYGNTKTFGYSVRLVNLSTTLNEGETGSYTGNDGKAYATICINGVEWLSRSLSETKFDNGDTIPIVTDNTEWSNLTTAGMCAYNNDEDNI